MNSEEKINKVDKIIIERNRNSQEIKFDKNTK